jgi:hypothetical protein
MQSGSVQVSHKFCSWRLPCTDELVPSLDKFISTADKDFASKFEGDDELDFILITADANAIPIGDLMRWVHSVMIVRLD